MIGFIIAGLVIGVIARLLHPGTENLGFLATLGLGLVGSIIGGVIASAIGTGDVMELNVIGTVFAVIAAIALIGIAETLAPKNKKMAHH